VRMICAEEEESCSRGDSRANLLYHALAMSQALNSPPTLARWQPNVGLRLLRVAFLAPAFVYARVFWTDWTTQYIAALYKVDNRLALGVELFASVTLFALGFVVWAYSSVMAQRWERAFLRINPRLRHITQAHAVDWLKLLPANSQDARLLERGVTDIVDRLKVADTTTTSTVRVGPEFVHPHRTRLRYRDLRKAIGRLVAAGEKMAREKCESESLGLFVRLTKLDLAQPKLQDGVCRLEGTLSFDFRKVGGDSATAPVRPNSR